MKPRILLINSPSRVLSEPPRWFPYGIAMVDAILNKEGYKVDHFNGDFQELSDLEKMVREKTYDIVGMGGLVTTFRYQEKAAQIVRKHNQDALVISGGGLGSAIPTEILDMIPELDVVVLGEAEQTIAGIVEASRDRGVLSRIPGLVIRNGERYVRTGTSTFIKNLDAIPFPVWENWSIDSYFRNGSFPLSPCVERARRRVSTLISRGCPFSCDFCYNSLGRRTYRHRSAENVVEELEELRKRFGIDFIAFLDEEFLIDKKNVLRFTELMKQKGLQTIAWAMATRSTSVRRDLLDELKSAGCDFIFYGFDSGSERMLKYMDKKMTTGDNFEAFVMTVEAGIHAVPNIIIGYDTETPESIQENYAFFQRLIDYGRKIKDPELKARFERSFNNFGEIYFATPYPGTELYIRNRAKIGDLRSFLERISFRDAYELTANCSDIGDNDLIAEKVRMTDFVKSFRF